MIIINDHYHQCDGAGDGEDPEGGRAGRQRAGLLHLPQVSDHILEDYR